MEIRPIGGPVGVDVLGIDDPTRLSADEVRQIEAALGEHLVVRLRGHPMDARRLAAFGRQFGELQRHIAKQYHHPDDADIVLMTNQDAQGHFDPVGARRGEDWHSDHAHEWIPPKATILHSLALPSPPGNTGFANMYQAYEAMPRQLKDRVTGRHATYCLGGRHAVNTALVGGKVPPAVVHPVIRQHPSTGRLSVFANPTSTLAIVGMSREESDALLDELFAWCRNEKYQWSQPWVLHDTVMWDNRCCWHKAGLDYPHDELRQFVRTMVRGTPTMERSEAEKLLTQ